MTKKTLYAQIEQLLEGLDSQEDIAEATKLLHKHFFEKSMSAELEDHLGRRVTLCFSFFLVTKIPLLSIMT